MPLRSNSYIPEPQIERLRRLAKKRDVSMSELVRTAIERFLDRDEKKKKTG